LTGLRQGVPKEVERKLKAMEILLNDPGQWPQKPDQAETIRQNLDGIVQTLPPSAAERILPQLVRLNWGVEALWNLHTQAHAEADNLDAAHATLNEFMDRYPRGYFKELHKELVARVSRLESQLRQFRLKQLIARTKRALENKEDAAAVYSSLEEYHSEKQVAALLQQLRVKVLEKTGSERIASLEKTLNQTSVLADERVRHVSLVTVQDGLVRLLVDLQLEKGAPKEVINKATAVLAECDKELLALAGRQQKENAKKLRRYQAWALDQIRKFDSPQGWHYDVTLPWVVAQLKTFGDATNDADWQPFQEFPSIIQLVQEKVGVDLSRMKDGMLPAAKRKEIYNEAWRTIGWKNDIHMEIAYRATRDGMVKFLLPIQPQLLDPPVAQLYQQAFSKGWQKLEGRPDQLFVAEQSAQVAKKTLQEVASSSR